MARKRYANEFKLEAVKLAERGEVPVAQVARDSGLHETVLRRWMQQYGKRPNGTRLTPEEHEELIRLRRENQRRAVVEVDGNRFHQFAERVGTTGVGGQGSRPLAVLEQGLRNVTTGVAEGSGDNMEFSEVSAHVSQTPPSPPPPPLLASSPSPPVVGPEETAAPPPPAARARCRAAP